MGSDAPSDHLRGHPIAFIDGEFRYADDGMPTVDGYRTRPCGVCQQLRTGDEHDPCIANLPGVMNACCGHGAVGEAYVQWRRFRVGGALAICVQWVLRIFRDLTHVTPKRHGGDDGK